MADRITYVGLDVHRKALLSRRRRVACGRGAGYSRIANTPTALDRLLRKAWRRQDDVAPSSWP